MDQENLVNLVNLTPHPVVLRPEGGGSVTIAPSGAVCRAREEREFVGHVSIAGVGVPVYRIAYGAPEGLPAPEPGTIYVVSALAAQAIRAHRPDRDDVVVVSDPVRDDQGRVIGARSLSRI